MTERLKFENGISPRITENLFILRENTHKNTHKLRNFQEISHAHRKTVRYGLETTANRTPFLLANLPNKLATF